MAVSCDVGTMFIISAREVGEDVIFTRQRDAFFVVDENPGAENMLKKSKAKYIKLDDQFYVLGDDAITLATIMGSSIRRPMSNGVINPEESEHAKVILHEIIKGVIGKPASDNEAICACIPAAPLDAKFNTIYHKAVIENALKSAGYSNINVINEGMALIYSGNPTVKTETEEVPFSGIGISFGAGMTNLAFSYRGLELVSFSVARGGDWIDEQVSTVQNKPTSKVTLYKEHKLNLSIPPITELDYALHTFYRSLIEYVIFNFKNEFKKTDKSIDEAIEIVIGGGTAMPKGFIQMFKNILKEQEFPFEIRDTRLAEDPHNAVSNGCLINAQALEE